MIGILLRHERVLRWLPLLSFAALLLGIEAVRELHAGRSSDDAVQRATGLLFALGLLAAVVPLACGARWYELTLPVEPKDLLRARLIAVTCIVGVPVLVAAALPALLSARSSSILLAAAGAMGVGLLAGHLPLLDTVRKGGPRLGALVLVLLPVAALAVVLWLLLARVGGVAASSACLGALVLAQLHATALWRTPSARLTLAGRVQGRVVEHTTPGREVLRVLLGPGQIAATAVTIVFLVAAVVILATDGASLRVVTFLVLVLGLTTGWTVPAAWRRRQLRLAGWPVPGHVGFARLLMVGSFPGLLALLAFGLQSDHALLKASDGMVSYREYGDRVYAYVHWPSALRRLAWGSPETADGEEAVRSHRTIVPGLRLVDRGRQLTGAIPEVRAEFRQEVRAMLAALTGAVPSAAATESALRAGIGSSLAHAFPDHPWLRRPADLFVLTCAFLTAFLLAALSSVQHRVYPRPVRGLRNVGFLGYFVFPFLLFCGDLLTIAEHRAALAILHQPALAVIPLTVLAMLVWWLFARLRGAELQLRPGWPPWVGAGAARRGGRRSAALAAATRL